jgi:hypothetical protein
MSPLRGSFRDLLARRGEAGSRAPSDARARLPAVEIEVALTKDHLERLAQTQPLTGIIELIWNALDADATEITVAFGRNELDGIEEIRVVDNGHGMTPDVVERAFGALGGSEKDKSRGSPSGRAFHGRNGQGRYKAAGIGNRIVWDTVGEDPSVPGTHVRTQIELRFSDLVRVTTSEPEPTDAPTGTKVVIPDLGTNPPEGLGGDGPVERLTATFALQLQNYNAHLKYGSTEIDPDAAQANRHDVELVAVPDNALLTIIEWNRKIDRGLYLCDQHGTPIFEQPPGIQAPGFNFTAYLQWTGFEGADELDLMMSNLDSGDRRQLIEDAKDAMRAYFKHRVDDQTREQVERWQAEKTYPFKGEAKDETERTVREAFNVVALSASSVVNTSDVRGRRFSLRILREALEQDPGSLRRVLTEVLELPEDRLRELEGLLDHTPLSTLIATSKEITNRLEFLRGLEEIVINDPELKKHTRERTQLHRILAGEVWVFGEEFALAVDDESLTTVLKRHMSILGREDFAEDIDAPVTDPEGHIRIVDLMLARSIGQSRNRREHLVIEFKRPSVDIGDDQAAQIRKYAGAVAQDERFESVDVAWDFIVVGTKVVGTPDIERRSPDRPFGQIMNVRGIRVWALTWGEILDNALHRLKFVRQHLDYQPSAAEAIRYLRATHAKYLPDVAVLSSNDDPGSDGADRVASIDGSVRGAEPDAADRPSARLDDSP